MVRVPDWSQTVATAAYTRCPTSSLPWTMVAAAAALSSLGLDGVGAPNLVHTHMRRRCGTEADDSDHGTEASRLSRLSSSPAGWHESDSNGGVWQQRWRWRECVDLADDMQHGGGAWHTSPDDKVLAPMEPDGEPNPGRWCGAEAMPYLVMAHHGGGARCSVHGGSGRAEACCHCHDGGCQRWVRGGAQSDGPVNGDWQRCA